MATESEIAWAGGLFEGEGWLSINDGQPIMGIQMSDKEVLDRFLSIIGVGKLYYRKPRVYSYEKIHTRKDQWAWRLSKKQDLLATLDLLEPWLSSRRKTRALDLREAAKLLQDRPGIEKGYKTQKVLNRPCGNFLKYRGGCRCELCKEAGKLYRKQAALNRRDKKSGTENNEQVHL